MTPSDEYYTPGWYDFENYEDNTDKYWRFVGMEAQDLKYLVWFHYMQVRKYSLCFHVKPGSILKY